MRHLYDPSIICFVIYLCIFVCFRDDSVDHKELTIHHIRPIFSFLDMELDDEHLQLVLKSIDRNGDGKVDWLDFYGFLLAPPDSKDVHTYNSKVPFNMFDQDKDGFIGLMDLEQASKRLKKHCPKIGHSLLVNCDEEYEKLLVDLAPREPRGVNLEVFQQTVEDLAPADPLEKA